MNTAAEQMPSTLTVRNPDFPDFELVAVVDVRRDAVTVRYTVINRGERQAVFMSQPGDLSSPLVNLGDDGVIEISERVVGVDGMTPTAPVSIRASSLGPGESVSRELIVPRPFARHWPAGYLEPRAAPLPEAPLAVRFCLGVAYRDELPGADAHSSADGIEVMHGNVLANDAQHLICTEAVSLS